MTDDLYTAAVEKAARRMHDADCERPWPQYAEWYRNLATAALDAIGFKEIVEALEFYAELDGNEGAEPWGSRARFALSRLTPPPE